MGYCKRWGFKESAEIADQIDRVLYYLYGDRSTELWKMYIKCSRYGIKDTGEIELSCFSVQNGIVSVQALCIGCECSNGCYECMFGGLVGRCDDNGSLYREFIDRFFLEIS